jgi:hypothetical protein
MENATRLAMNPSDRPQARNPQEAVRSGGGALALIDRCRYQSGAEFSITRRHGEVFRFARKGCVRGVGSEWSE